VIIYKNQQILPKLKKEAKQTLLNEFDLFRNRSHICQNYQKNKDLIKLSNCCQNKPKKVFLTNIETFAHARQNTTFPLS